MSEARTWMGVCALVVVLACTVGEAPPRAPSTEPGVDPAAPAAPEDSAAVEAARAAEARASELLAESRLAYEAGEVEEALQRARQLLSEHPGTASADPARWVAARAAFALGRYAEAREDARRHAADQPGESARAEEARALAELAADALEEPTSVAVVGAVLPRTGPRVLVRYADWILEGVELAVAEAERAQNRRIELVVVDDEGGTRVGEAVRELERRGAVAIVGPMLPEHVATAARARTDSRLVLVSPTSTETPGWPAAYTINASDARGAQELGRYAADVGLRQAAVLYPRVAEYERKAQAFAVEFETLGGEVRAMVPYDSGTTTFATHMRQILEAVAPDSGYDPVEGRALSMGDTVVGDPTPVPVGGDSLDPWRGRPPQEPFALFVPAPPRDVPQIAPQIAFYGLDSAGVQVLGDEAWASAMVRRLVPGRDLNGVVAASRFPPHRASAAADPAFVQAYEERYRRSLDNQLPALGYDAAHLVMQALPNRTLQPSALARRFQLLAGIRGATGLLSVRANRVVRTSYLVVIRDGELLPAPYPWEYAMPPVRPRLPVDSAQEWHRR